MVKIKIDTMEFGSEGDIRLYENDDEKCMIRPTALMFGEYIFITHDGTIAPSTRYRTILNDFLSKVECDKVIVKPADPLLDLNTIIETTKHGIKIYVKQTNKKDI